MPSLTMTVEENGEYASLMTDINTYVDEMAARFIVGDSDIETEWDAYIESLYSSEFELGRAIEIYQGALDRYYAK